MSGLQPGRSVQAYGPSDATVDGSGAADAVQGGGIGRTGRLLWRNRFWLALSMVIGLGLGVAVIRYYPPSYKSGVSILLDPKQAGSLGANQDFATIAVDSGKIADVEQILISSRLLQMVVRADHLESDPQFGGVSASRSRRFLNVLMAQDDPVPDTPAIRMERAVDRLGRMIRTARVGLTYVITITVTAPSGSQAQHLATAVAEAYIADQVATKYAEAHDDAAWLRERLEQIRPELVASESKVLSIRHKFGLFQTDNVPGSTLNRQRLTELTTELAKAQGEAAQAGAQYAMATRTVRAGGSPDIGTSMVLDNLRTSAAEAERKFADIGAVYGPEHPAYIEAKLSLASLNNRLGAESHRLTERLSERYKATQARVASVQSLLGAIVHDEAASDNVHGRGLLNEAERMAELYRNTYGATLNRMHDVEQQETRQKAEAGIISPAPFPEHPSFPRPNQCLPLGAMFGLCVGAGLISSAALLNKKIDDQDLAETQLRLPVLGVIPWMARRELGNDDDPSRLLAYMQGKTSSSYADSMRRLRLCLHSQSGPDTKVVQFTSPASGDGKSTLAASLALSSASSGIRTVLLDFDVQRPSIQSMFKGLLSPDIVGQLAPAPGHAPENIQFSKLPLEIMTADALGISSASSLADIGVRTVVAEMRRRFDLVVIDSPPVLASSDAVLASQFADATVLVCAVQSTSSAEALRATRALRLAGAQISGVVLNKAKARTRAYDYLYGQRPLALPSAVAVRQA